MNASNPYYTRLYMTAEDGRLPAVSVIRTILEQNPHITTSKTHRETAIQDLYNSITKTYAQSADAYNVSGETYLITVYF